MELRDVQSAELVILKKILEIIKKYNLDYYALGGTLLGAVRHNGFIPWDDDIDIGLPRPDYETFLKIAENELPEPFHLYAFKEGKASSEAYFAKVVNEEVIIKSVRSGHEVEHPVWVDVFPLDGVPAGKIRFFIWKNKGMLLTKLLTMALIGGQYDSSLPREAFVSKKEKAIRVIIKLGIDKKLDKGFLWNRLDQELKKYDYQNSKRIINFCGNWHMKELFDKSVYGAGADYVFEDILIRGPEDYDFVLTQMYGNYMTPPPENQRNHHSIKLE